jgi:hypothetical protein
MTSGMKTVMYPVTNIATAKQLYGRLFGVAPYMDEAYSSASTSRAKTSVSTPMVTARA